MERKKSVWIVLTTITCLVAHSECITVPIRIVNRIRKRVPVNITCSNNRRVLAGPVTLKYMASFEFFCQSNVFSQTCICELNLLWGKRKPLFWIGERKYFKAFKYLNDLSRCRSGCSWLLKRGRSILMSEFSINIFVDFSRRYHSRIQ